MTRLTFWLQTNKIGSQVSTTIDIDDDEWDKLDSNDREDFAKDLFWDVALSRLGDWDWQAENDR
jgi:hypothetical protein